MKQRYLSAAQLPSTTGSNLAALASACFSPCENAGLEDLLFADSFEISFAVEDVLDVLMMDEASDVARDFDRFVVKGISDEDESGFLDACVVSGLSSQPR